MKSLTRSMAEAGLQPEKGHFAADKPSSALSIDLYEVFTIDECRIGHRAGGEARARVVWFKKHA